MATQKAADLITQILRSVGVRRIYGVVGDSLNGITESLHKRGDIAFNFADIEGTLVGLWSPGFSSAFSVAGYHLHFLSTDRQHGGHLLEVAADTLRLRVEALTDFHLALPESEAFLKADLSKNTAQELAYAEQAH
jgi:alpha-acetolactate decarboxylase